MPRLGKPELVKTSVIFMESFRGEVKQLLSLANFRSPGGCVALERQESLEMNAAALSVAFLFMISRKERSSASDPCALLVF